MTRPKSVLLMGQPFAIDYVPGTDEYLAKASDMPNVGTARIGKQRLIVAEDLGPDQERDTLLHEILHGLLGLVVLDIKHEVEERVVGTLTPLLLDTLRRNPAVLGYLTEGGDAGG